MLGLLFWVGISIWPQFSGRNSQLVSDGLLYPGRHTFRVAYSKNCTVGDTQFAGNRAERGTSFLKLVLQTQMFGFVRLQMKTSFGDLRATYSNQRFACKKNLYKSLY